MKEFGVLSEKISTLAFEEMISKLYCGDFYFKKAAGR